MAASLLFACKKFVGGATQAFDQGKLLTMSVLMVMFSMTIVSVRGWRHGWLYDCVCMFIAMYVYAYSCVYVFHSSLVTNHWIMTTHLPSPQVLQSVFKATSLCICLTPVSFPMFHKYISMYVYIYVYIHIYMYLSIYIYMCVCVSWWWNTSRSLTMSLNGFYSFSNCISCWKEMHYV